MKLQSWLSVWAVLGLSGCAAAPPPEPPPHVIGCPTFVEVSDAFDRGLARLSALDKLDGWTDARCEEVEALFLEAADEDGRVALVARYDAGVARQRCGHVAAAREHYRAVLEREPRFARARSELVRLALIERPDAPLDGPIEELQRAVVDSEYRAASVLCDLARLQLRRGNTTKDADGEGDLDRAQKNLRRALAVDDAYIPAYAELAAYLLERARRGSGEAGRSSSGGRARGEALELAFLVATQALRRAPGSAELHNTLGLIAVEAGDPSLAVKSFGEARELEPTFFEAHMSYAAINLSFRGFARAEEAYGVALKLRPRDYEATLGLAVALRGQDAKLSEAEALLERAKGLAPQRPEAYFNHAILAQELAGKAGEPGGSLERAIGLYEAFVERATGTPALADAILDVTAVPSRSDDACVRLPLRGSAECRRGRLHDLRETLEFRALTARDRASREEEAENRAALVEATEP